MEPSLHALLFPLAPRRLAWGRGWNMGFRTLHLLTSGILLGGHVFGIAPDRLMTLLYVTLLSGAGLVALELYRSCAWAYQVMGVLVELKLLLVVAAGIWWDQRVPLLVTVAILGSFGSHLPARYRHFSLLHGRVLDETKPSAPSRNAPR